MRLATYYATRIDGEPKATGHVALRRARASDLRTLAWASADVSAAERVIARQLQHSHDR